MLTTLWPPRLCNPSHGPRRRTRVRVRIQSSFSRRSGDTVTFISWRLSPHTRRTYVEIAAGDACPGKPRTTCRRVEVGGYAVISSRGPFTRLVARSELKWIRLVDNAFATFSSPTRRVCFLFDFSRQRGTGRRCVKAPLRPVGTNGVNGVGVLNGVGETSGRRGFWWRVWCSIVVLRSV